MSCPALDLHPRTLRANIWRDLLSATDQEIHDGISFYPGAHGLCRLFASSHPHLSLSPSSVAGIYAALSPMNGWDTNVANVLDVLRHGLSWSSSVNTTDINHWKALAILHGTDPSIALGRGRKVLAFWRAIADPADPTPIPVDRHLLCLALGHKITSNQELRSFAGSGDVYVRVGRAYAALGQRERMGNRLASIAERHGRLHARLQLLYMLRDRMTGQFLPSPVPSFPDQLDDNPVNRADSGRTDDLADDLSDIPF